MREINVQNVETLLDADVAADASSLTVESGDGFPDAGFQVLIGGEVIAVGLRDGASFEGLTRGVEGTAAESHNVSDAVWLVVGGQAIVTRQSPRVTVVEFDTSVVPDADSTDILEVGALTDDVTIADPTGSPADGQRLVIRLVQDEEGERVVSFGAAFAFGSDVEASGCPTSASEAWEMSFRWCASEETWRAVGMVRGF